MSVVYVPQLPARYEPASGTWVPSVNIKPAERWGELRVLFPQSVSRAATAPLAAAMRESMDGYTADDCICAVGDPGLMMIAACIAARKTGGLLRLLRWDRQARDYNLVEVRL